MADLIVSSPVDTFLQAADKPAMRDALDLPFVKLFDEIVPFGTSFLLTGIPQTYTHLKLIGRVQHYGNDLIMFIAQLNSVAVGYETTFTYVTNANIQGGQSGGTDGMCLGQGNCTFEVDFYHYANASIEKRSHGRVTKNGTLEIRTASLGPNNDAVTSMLLKYSNDQGYGANNTLIQLYGIR